jgi:hypothetical protein
LRKQQFARLQSPERAQEHPQGIGLVELAPRLDGVEDKAAQSHPAVRDPRPFLALLDEIRRGTAGFVSLPGFPAVQVVGSQYQGIDARAC